MPFLFEPYNAYQKPPKKKHWMEIAEEEALIHRIQLQEQEQRKELFHEALKQHLVLREANAKQNPSNLNNQNVALPQYAPQPASQQVQDGQFAAPAGGGGWVIPSELESQEQANFSATPQSGFGKLTVTFANLSFSPNNDTFLWDFGTGSLTSTAITPPALIYVQTGSYTVTLQETSSTGFKTKTTKVITVADPTLNAWVSGDVSGVAPLSSSQLTFYTYNGSGIVTGYFHFGDGTASSPFLNNATIVHVYGTGSFTASLALTESAYGHTNVATVYISASAPTVTPALVGVPTTGAAPLTVQFTNNTVYNGHGTLNYLWDFGSGSLTSTATSPKVTYSGSGTYTVSLQVTESSYNIAAKGTRTNYIVVT